jgi:Tol biopolymer transport system component
VEYPVGKTLYEAEGGAWPADVRLSLRGELAFVDHYYGGDDGYVAVLDQKGNKRRVSPRFSSLQGLAWSPQGDEIWFTGATNGSIRHLYAVTPAGKMRVLARMPGNLKLYDIASDGRLLATIEDARNSVYFMGPQDARPRELTWLDWAAGPILSADGKTIVFSESGEGAGGTSMIYLRPTDGSPALRLGYHAAATSISPDGKWVTADSNDEADRRIVLLPTKAGNPVYLETGSLRIARVAGWLPDSQRIVFQANEPGHPPRIFVQEIRGGKPKPATREGITGFAVTPDGTAVLGNDGDNRYLAPLDGSPEKPLPVLAGYQVAGITADGRSVYAHKTADNPPRIYRIDLTTGRAEFFREIPVTDATGLLTLRPIRITPDGKSMAWSTRRSLSELYLVDGLK